MKAILKTIKSKQCANIMNLVQSILVIKDKREATAIQKLIDENGYAEIYVYCCKINKKHYHLIESIDTDTGITEYEIDYYIGSEDYLVHCYEGKVAFKFRCYKVEEIPARRFSVYTYPYTETLDDYELLDKSCLSTDELENYLGNKNGYAIHISDLEIFDEPKELSEFTHYNKPSCESCPFAYTADCDYYKEVECDDISLTKAPQNFCYVEVKK